MSPPTGFLEHALRYAEMGWPVFPLRPGGKEPLIPKRDGGNGVKDATTEASQIVTWWGRWPTANIGLACGGWCWMLDADFKGFLSDELDGADAIRALQEHFGRLPPTLSQHT